MPVRNIKHDAFLYSSEDEDDDVADDCYNCWKPNPKKETYFDSFLRDWSVHGLKYLTLDQPLCPRLFWILSIIAAVGVSVYLIMVGVVKDLVSNPVIMSFQQSEITIDRIPFPAVTICTSSKRKQDGYENLYNEYNEMLYQHNTYGNVSDEDLEQLQLKYYALHYLFEICRDSVSFSDKFKTIPYNHTIATMPDNSSVLENVMDYAEQGLHKCEDIIVLCLWAMEPFNCTSEFIPINTLYGHCCVMNMMPEFILRKIPRPKNLYNSRRTQKALEAWDKWDIDVDLIEPEITHNHKVDVPKHQRSPGMRAGLSLLLHPCLEFSTPECESMDGTGFRVQVHSPIDYPHINDFGKTLKPGTETFVNIQGAITMPDKDVEHISKERRQCYFLDEYKLESFRIYTQQNCVDECIMFAVYKKCNCTRLYMPRKDQRLCTTNDDYHCMKDVTNEIKENGTLIYCESCWPSCSQIEYFPSTTSFKLRDDVNLWESAGNNDSNTWNREGVAVVHLFFGSETVESRARKTLYGYMEILASAGGVVGLTLGISMISLVEPIYFLTIRLIFKRRSSSVSTVHHSNDPKSTKVVVQPVHDEVKNDAKLTKRIPRAWIQN